MIRSIADRQRGFSLPLTHILLAICAVLIWIFGWWAVLSIAIAALLMAAAVAIFENGKRPDQTTGATGEDDWPSELEYALVLPTPLEEICEKLSPALHTTEFSFSENAFNEYWRARADRGWKIVLRREKNEPMTPLHVTFKHNDTDLERDHHEYFGSTLAESLGVETTLLYEPVWSTKTTFNP